MWTPIDKNLTKICRTCNIRKLKTDFYASPSGKDGLSPSCKTCTKIKKQERVEEQIKAGTFDYNKPRYKLLVKKAAKEGVVVDMSQDEFGVWWSSIENVCYYCKHTHSDIIPLREKVEAYEGHDIAINRVKSFFTDADIVASRIDLTRDYHESNVIKVCVICKNVRGTFFLHEEMESIGKMVFLSLVESIKNVNGFNET